MILLSLIAAFGINAQEPKPEPTVEDLLRKEVERIMQYEVRVDFDETPGFIIGIYDHGNTAVLHFGSRTPGQEDTLRADDCFEIGSVSKVLTAIRTVQLIDGGMLKPSTRLGEVFPGSPLSNSVAEISRSTNF